MAAGNASLAAIILLLTFCVNRGCETSRLRLHQIFVYRCHNVSPEPLDVVVMGCRNFKASGKQRFFLASVTQHVDSRLCPVLHLAAHLAGLWSLSDAFLSIEHNAWSQIEFYDYADKQSSPEWQPHWLQYRLFPRTNKPQHGQAEFTQACAAHHGVQLKAQLARLPEKDQPSNVMHVCRSTGLQYANNEKMSAEAQNRIGCWKDSVTDSTRATAYIDNIQDQDSVMRMGGHRPPGSASAGLEDKHIESLKYEEVREAIASRSTYDADMLSRLEQGVFQGLDTALMAVQQRKAMLDADQPPPISVIEGDSSSPEFRRASSDISKLQSHNTEQRQFLEGMQYHRGVFLAGLFHLADENRGGKPLPCFSSPVLLQPDMQAWLERVLYPAFRKHAAAQKQTRAVVPLRRS